MSSDWAKVVLSDLAEIVTGYPFKGAKYLPPKNGIRVVRGDNVTERSIRWGDKEKCWEEVTPELLPYILEAGDVVIGMDGSKVGKNFAVITQKDSHTLLAQRVARVRAKKGVCQKFIRYAICNDSFTSYVRSVHTGTSIPHISKGQIEKFRVVAPPLEIQTAIGVFLETLDDRITLLRETNKTLESIAQAIFKSWFVDFDPVRAKMEGRQPEGMDEDTATLFPHAFQDSELGLIPRGWTVHRLQNITERITKGTTPTTLKRPFVENGINFIKAESINQDGGFLYEKFAFIDDETHHLLKRSQLATGDILISIAGTIGRTAIVTRDELPANTNQAIALIRPRQEVYPSGLIWRFLTRQDTRQAMTERVVHAVQANLSLGTLSALTLAIPPEESIRTLYSSAFEPIDQAKENNSQRIRTLLTLRDTLLPRLISGQLRLPEAQELTEPALP